MEVERQEPTGLEPARLAVRSYYDAQKLRIEMSNRRNAQVREGVLSDEWDDRLAAHDLGMQAIERGLIKDIHDACKHVDIYDWRAGSKASAPPWPASSSRRCKTRRGSTRCRNSGLTVAST